MEKAFTNTVSKEEWLFNRQIELQAQEQTMRAESAKQEALLREKEKELHALQTEVNVRDEKLIENEETVTWLNNEWKAAKHTVDELHQSNHKWFLKSEQSEEQLQAVYNSYSWRITWPLRKLLQLFLWLFSLSARFLAWLAYPLKLLTRRLLIATNSFVLKRPKLQVRAQAWLDHHPIITARLQQLKQVDAALDQPQSSTPQVPQSKPITTDNETSILVSELSSLTPSARRIYHALDGSINERQKDAC
jgi:O-antigen chain-terminating methyltransferase